MRGIIFDLDGTLVDSRLDFAAMRRELGLQNGEGLLEHLASLTDPAARQQAEAVIERHELAGAHAATWIEGAEHALHQLRSAQVPMAIVTRNMRSATDHMVKKLGIPIEHIITREDCQQVKPHPEGLLAVASYWQIAPRALAYLGDFKFDLEAARHAGMHAWLWRNDSNSEFEHLADAVFHRFEEITERLL
nr:HAD family hydrolase [Simiduia aestuariiviva]